MSDTEVYEAILSPEGVPLAEADETKIVTVDIPTTTAQDALEDEVVDHIVATEAVDLWAFRNHWRIASLVRPDATPEQRLRDALLSFTVETDASDEELYMIGVDVWNDRTDTWENTILAVEREIQENFENWKEQLEADYPEVRYLPSRYLGEAMVRTVAEHNPMLADEFMQTPLDAAREFFQQCFMYGSQVADTTTDI